jgi:uncharacterized membrane protein (DUF441 family)
MLSAENLGLVALVLLGLLARSTLVATSAAVLLCLRLGRLSGALPFLEAHGVEIGLLFLTLAMLAPFATGQIQMRDLWRSFGTVPGVVAVVGGALATHVNGRGLGLLEQHGELMVAIVLGSLIGIVAFGGKPVGPLMAAGLTYLMLGVIQWVTGTR